MKYRDLEYEVAALVSVPTALSYRYYGADEFILNDQTFLQDTGTADIMYYAFDVDDGATADMEGFLRDYTENVNPQLDYESKATYAAEFEGFRGMFLMLGGALSFIVGLVGVLNFFNAVLTGIITRRREFAVLQSIGMTGGQLKKMLVLEASSTPWRPCCLSAPHRGHGAAAGYRREQPVLVLHLPFHPGAHPAYFPHLRGPGVGDPPADLPLHRPAHRGGAPAGGGMTNGRRI